MCRARNEETRRRPAKRGTIERDGPIKNPGEKKGLIEGKDGRKSYPALNGRPMPWDSCLSRETP